MKWKQPKFKNNKKISLYLTLIILQIRFSSAGKMKSLFLKSGFLQYSICGNPRIVVQEFLLHGISSEIQKKKKIRSRKEKEDFILICSLKKIWFEEIYKRERLGFGFFIVFIFFFACFHFHYSRQYNKKKIDNEHDKKYFILLHVELLIFCFLFLYLIYVEFSLQQLQTNHFFWYMVENFMLNRFD